jgi:diguanylate cyclase (GGDEF)-like protein/PAS domain S-box-containing protein/putative nucleotidyltransferase with HDIG domain
MATNPFRNLPDVLFAAVEQSPSLVTITDTLGVIEYVNPAFCRLTGFTAAELAGRPIRELKSGELPHAVYERLWRQLRDGQDWHGEFCNRRKDGEPYWERAVISAIRDAQGVTLHYLKVAEDVTRQKELERALQEVQQQRESLVEQLRQASARDPLTGLFNRRGFEAEFSRVWQLGLRRQLPTALLVMDIDRFKDINDTHGHLAGDQVLVEAAQLVSKETRAMDVTCRYGGDELLVLLPLTGLEEALRAAARLREVFAGHVFCQGAQNLRATLSIGVACSSGGDVSAARLLAQADQALYRAKQDGRNCVRSWEPEATRPPAAEPAATGGSARRAPLSGELAEDRQSHRAAVELLVSVLALREQTTGAHSRRVAQISRLLAQEMGLGEGEIDRVVEGALLHDIGKVAIPDAVLLKQGPLSEDEWRLVRSHPRLGRDILRACPILAQVAEAVYAHQERYDGSGYPCGLRGEQIRLEARIFAVADAYDAIRSRRSYSAGQDAAAAAAEIVRQGGSQFDPQVVAAFRRCQARIEDCFAAGPDAPAPARAS